MSYTKTESKQSIGRTEKVALVGQQCSAGSRDGSLRSSLSMADMFTTSRQRTTQVLERICIGRDRKVLG